MHIFHMKYQVHAGKKALKCVCVELNEKEKDEVLYRFCYLCLNKLWQS